MFEVEGIVDKRGSGKDVEYLIKWKGYDSEENEWMPLNDLIYIQDMIEEYEHQSKKQRKNKKDKVKTPTKF